MANNILSGTIKINTPGVKETFASVEQVITNLKTKLATLPASAQQSATGLTTAFSKVTAIKVPPVKVQAEVEKITVPTVDPIKVPVQVESVQIPKVDIPPVEVPVKVGTIETPKANIQPIEVPAKVGIIETPKVNIPPIEVPVKTGEVNTAPVKLSLDNLGKSIKPLAIHLDTNKLRDGIANIDKMKAEVEQFRKALKLATDPRDIAILTKGINTLNSQIKQIERAGNPLKGFHIGVLQSERTLAGFEGVLKNVTQGTGSFENTITGLLENFNRLRTETGGTKNALNTLAHEFLGGGGLILGIGLAIPLIEMLGEKLFSSGDEAKEHAKKIKEAKQALDEYVEGLNDINKALVHGKQGAQEQLVTLQTLYTATQNANIPLADRKKLVDELQEQYPKYFGNIKDEIILAGGAETAYKNLSVAILASARARAGQDALVEIQKDLLAVEQQYAQAVGETAKQQQVLQHEEDKRAQQKGATLNFNSAKIGQAQEDLNKKLKIQNEFLEKRNELQTRANQLSNVVQRTVEQTPEALLKLGGKIETPKIQKPKVEKQDFSFLFDFLPFDPSGKLKPEQQAKLTDSIDKFEKEFAGILKGIDFTRQAKTDKEKIQLALAFDVKLKAGKVEFDTKALTEAIHKSLKPEDLLPLELFKDLDVVSLFIKGIDNGIQAHKGDVKGLDDVVDKDQIISKFKTKFAQIGAALPKIFEAVNKFEQKEFVTLDDLFDTSKFSNAEAVAAITKAFSKEKDRFAEIGNQIGSQIGNGFGDVFQKIFSDQLQKAIKSGLSGKELENFKAVFESISAVAAVGIAGIANSFATLANAVLSGKNGIVAFGEALKSVFKAIAVEIIKDIVLAGILSALSSGGKNPISFLSALGKILGGSHEKGLKRVPKDGYIAELHKDEMVVPAKQASTLRNVMQPDFSIPTFNNVTETIKNIDLTKSIKRISGSHYTGLRQVPYDGYIAEVHKDEMIVPAAKAKVLRQVLDINFSIPKPKISGINIPSIPSISPINIPSINQVGTSKLNSAAGLFNGSRKPIDMKVSADFRIKGNDLVASHQKTIKQQGLTF